MMHHPARPALRVYDVEQSDQWRPDGRPDLTPPAPRRREWLERVAFDATVYGLPLAYQYAQMCEQALDGSTGFNAFMHHRRMATPDFADFRTPNVDTTYSNAWLDLRAGPVRVHVPDMGRRYYTLHLLDAHGNSSNISSRTLGPDGGEFWLAPVGDEPELPTGARRFTVPTPLMWVLMRIGLGEGPLEDALALQDETTISGPASGGTQGWPRVDQTGVEEDWEAFFAAMSTALRINGCPREDVALVGRFDALALLEPDFAADALDRETAASLQSGFEAAMEFIAPLRGSFADDLGTGWRTGSAGDHGVNYLRRAVQNYVGTGGNVRAEKVFFVAHADGHGDELDGSRHSYRVRLSSPPPASHWSVTLYDAETRMLHPNTIDRWSISPRTPGLVVDHDGSITIVIAPSLTDEPANWLPSPRAPFYVDLRVWEPGAAVRNGAWEPGPIMPLTSTEAGP